MPDSRVPLSEAAYSRLRDDIIACRLAPGQRHDDGFYRGISPFARTGNEPLASAMHAWCRVVSHPEPGLALPDAGKRDVPFDEGLPEPQLVADLVRTYF